MQYQHALMKGLVVAHFHVLPAPQSQKDPFRAPHAPGSQMMRWAWKFLGYRGA